MFGKLEEVSRKYDELTGLLSDPAIITNQQEFMKFSKEQSEISDVVEKYREYQGIIAEIAGAEEMAADKDSDPDFREMAEAELAELKAKREAAEAELKLLLIPKDPNDEKNTFLEIRAGTGGDEAALFAGDLFRMYSKFAEKNRWKVEVMSVSESGGGGLKEVIALVTGKSVYSRLKYESGVHRVQRVPATESQGRIHTSAATVAVLPEAEEADVHIEAKDLRVDLYCASGPGGQCVNTTYSAVRLTHLPTGIVVQCQDERSQIKNKAKAMKVLMARILEKRNEELDAERSQERKSMVGTGDRSERIRTYNFPQNRVTDHRIGLTLYKLDYVMEGELDELIGPLTTNANAERLQNL
ncbi:MAG: peptide chain release factor 1 [Nitrospirae bacterium]|nr:peptide chain release factor 1 [Nitrospirota bacterium]